MKAGRIFPNFQGLSFPNTQLPSVVLLEIIALGVGFKHDFFAPGVGVSHFLCARGEFAFPEKFPWGLPEGWSGLEFTDTLLQDVPPWVLKSFVILGLPIPRNITFNAILLLFFVDFETPRILTSFESEKEATPRIFPENGYIGTPRIYSSWVAYG